jgi:hypothetical protein
LIIGLAVFALVLLPLVTEPGMKKFSNETFSFEIQYPEQDTVIHELYIPKSVTGNIYRSLTYEVAFIKKDNFAEFTEVSVQDLYGDSVSYVDGLTSDGKLIVKDITIDQTPAKEVIYPPGIYTGSKNGSRISVYMVRGSRLYEIRFESQDRSLADSPDVEKMLRSFRFTQDLRFSNNLIQPGATSKPPTPVPQIQRSPLSIMALDISDLPESYVNKHEEGGEYYHTISFVKNESGNQVIEIEEDIAIYASEEIARNIAGEKTWVEKFVANSAKYNTTFEYLTDPKIGDTSQAFKIIYGKGISANSGNTEYIIDFSKNNASVELRMLGTKTDYDLFRELAGKALGKIWI